MASVFKRPGRTNWMIGYRDETGRKREVSSKTGDKRLAQRIANQIEEDVVAKRKGLIDPDDHRFATHNRRAIAEHVVEYLTTCERAGQAAKNIDEKRRHLERLIAEGEIKRLSDLTPDLLEANMAAMTVRKKTDQRDAEGKPVYVTVPASARTRNFRRQAAVAFGNWCKKTGRVRRNALEVVPKADERADRRRVRRALEDDEAARLLAVARERDAELNGDPHYPHKPSCRAAWYSAALYAGLRRGDLKRLRWADIDFAAGTITIANGKAKRTDVIPMHPEVVSELEAIRPTMQINAAGGRVFQTAVTARTQRADFERAGITADSEGRVADLHALRTTMATNLARAGVAPQTAMKLLRHASIETTMRSYTVLTLNDTARAIEALPVPVVGEAQAATGTGDARPSKRQSRTRADGVSGAHGRASVEDADGAAHHGKPRQAQQKTASRRAKRSDAEVERKGLEPSTSSLQSWHSPN